MESDERATSIPRPSVDPVYTFKVRNLEPNIFIQETVDWSW